jgi:hypothetical protein
MTDFTIYTVLNVLIIHRQTGSVHVIIGPMPDRIWEMMKGDANFSFGRIAPLSIA